MTKYNIIIQNQIIISFMATTSQSISAQCSLQLRTLNAEKKLMIPFLESVILRARDKFDIGLDQEFFPYLVTICVTINSHYTGNTKRNSPFINFTYVRAFISNLYASLCVEGESLAWKFFFLLCCPWVFAILPRTSNFIYAWFWFIVSI